MKHKLQPYLLAKPKHNKTDNVMESSSDDNSSSESDVNMLDGGGVGIIHEPEGVKKQSSRGYHRTQSFNRQIANPSSQTIPRPLPPRPAHHRSQPQTTWLPRGFYPPQVYITSTPRTSPAAQPIPSPHRQPNLGPVPFSFDGRRLTQLDYFHYYFALNDKIKALIWFFALPGPRIVTIEPEYRMDQSENRLFFTDYQLPAEYIRTQSQFLPPSLKGVLQTCRESRAVALSRYFPAFEGAHQTKPIYFDWNRDTLLLPSFTSVWNLIRTPNTSQANAFSSLTLAQIHNNLQHLTIRGPVPLDIDYLPASNNCLKIISMFWALRTLTLNMEDPFWEPRFVEARNCEVEAEIWQANIRESVLDAFKLYRTGFVGGGEIALPAVEFATERETSIKLYCQRDGENKIFYGPIHFEREGRLQLRSFQQRHQRYESDDSDVYPKLHRVRRGQGRKDDTPAKGLKIRFSGKLLVPRK